MTTPTPAPQGPGPERIGPFRVVADLPPSAVGRCHLGVRDGGDPIELVVVHPALAADPEFRQRFATAVRAARGLGHPSLAPVVAADPDADVPWLALNWVPTVTLDRAVAETGPLPPGTVRTMASGVAGALASWHVAGLVHGGVEPGLVRLTRSGPVLYGAVAAAARPRPGLDGVAVRSPGYLSPEQADGQEPGPASDVFSLASVVAFAATGRAPFGDDDGRPAGSTALGVLRRIRAAKPDGPAILDDPVRVVVEESMRRDPGERPDAATVRDRYSAGRSAAPLPSEIAALLPDAPATGAPRRPAPGSTSGGNDTLYGPPPAAPGATPGPGPAGTYPGTAGSGPAFPAAQHPGPPHPAAGQPGPPLPGAPPPGFPYPGFQQDGVPYPGAGHPPFAPGAGPPPGIPFPPGAGGYPGPPPARRRISRRALFGGVAALVVAGAAGGGLWAALGRGSSAPAQRWQLPGPGGNSTVRLIGVSGLAVVSGPGPTIRAFDVVTGRPRWTYSLDGVPYDVPLVGQDALYVGARSSLICVDAVGGRQRWESRFASALALVGSIIVGYRLAELTADQQYELIGLRATDGALVWRIPMDRHPDSTPVVSGDGRAHLRMDTEVVTVEAESGRVLWRKKLPEQPFGMQLCAGALLLTATSDPEVVALDAVTGDQRWTRPGDPGQKTAPNLGTDGTVLVANVAGKLAGIDPRSGGPTWTSDTRSGSEFRYVSGSPVVTDTLVLGPGTYSDFDDHRQSEPTLFAFDRQDGSRQWSLTLPSRINADYYREQSGPILIDDTIVLSVEDGGLFAFGPVR